MKNMTMNKTDYYGWISDIIRRNYSDQEEDAVDRKRRKTTQINYDQELKFILEWENERLGKISSDRNVADRRRDLVTRMDLVLKHGKYKIKGFKYIKNEDTAELMNIWINKAVELNNKCINDNISIKHKLLFAVSQYLFEKATEDILAENDAKQKKEIISVIVLYARRFAGVDFLKKHYEDFSAFINFDAEGHWTGEITQKVFDELNTFFNNYISGFDDEIKTEIQSVHLNYKDFERNAKMWLIDALLINGEKQSWEYAYYLYNSTYRDIKDADDLFGEVILNFFPLLGAFNSALQNNLKEREKEKQKTKATTISIDDDGSEDDNNNNPADHIKDTRLSPDRRAEAIDDLINRMVKYLYCMDLVNDRVKQKINGNGKTDGLFYTETLAQYIKLNDISAKILLIHITNEKIKYAESYDLDFLNYFLSSKVDYMHESVDVPLKTISCFFDEEKSNGHKPCGFQLINEVYHKYTDIKIPSISKKRNTFNKHVGELKDLILESST